MKKIIALFYVLSMAAAAQAQVIDHPDARNDRPVAVKSVDDGTVHARADAKHHAKKHGKHHSKKHGKHHGKKKHQHHHNHPRTQAR